MEEEYREKLVSVSLSDTEEPLIEQNANYGISRYYTLCCKKPLRYIVKIIKRLSCCFTKQSNKQL